MNVIAREPGPLGSLLLVGIRAQMLKFHGLRGVSVRPVC